MADQPTSIESRLVWDDDNPVTVTGRKARTKQVGDATLIASAHPETLITRIRYDEHGNRIEKHVLRIRRVR
jgi:YD repeat-containing protein